MPFRQHELGHRAVPGHAPRGTRDQHAGDRQASPGIGGQVDHAGAMRGLRRAAREWNVDRQRRGLRLGTQAQFGGQRHHAVLVRDLPRQPGERQAAIAAAAWLLAGGLRPGDQRGRVGQHRDLPMRHLMPIDADAERAVMGEVGASLETAGVEWVERLVGMVPAQMRRGAAATGDADADARAGRRGHVGMVGPQGDRRLAGEGGGSQPRLDLQGGGRWRRHEAGLERLRQPEAGVGAGDDEAGHQRHRQQAAQGTRVARRQPRMRPADAQPAQLTADPRQMRLPQRILRRAHRWAVGQHG